MENNIVEQAPSLFENLPEEIVSRLTPLKMRAVNLFMTGMYNNSEIAGLLNVHPQTITRWFKEPEVQFIVQELQRREGDYMDSQIKSLRTKAINAMQDLLDSPIDAVKLSAAKDILNRTGHGATQKVSIEKRNVNIETALKSANVVELSPEDYKVIDLDDVLSEVKGNG